MGKDRAMGFASGMDRAAAVLRAEAARVEAMRVQATPPAEVGPVPVAHALGPWRVVTDYVAVPGGMRRQVGRRMEVADVFDVMLAQAQRRHGDSEAPFMAPLSWAQMAMGRHYRSLVERYNAGGVRCSQMEAGRGGGGDGFMDAYVAVGREIDRIRARIGTGSALVLRRVRPSDRGSRATISDREVVDRVCLSGLTLDQVLRRNGWSVTQKHRQAVLAALTGALDRMQGYDLQRPTR